MKNEVLEDRTRTFYVVKVRGLFVSDVVLDDDGQIYSISTSMNENHLHDFELFEEASKVVRFLDGIIEKHTVRRTITKQIKMILTNEDFEIEEETNNE